jgi:hypothetical protein
VYELGLRREHSFSLGLHNTVFQAEIYAIKPCIMENTEKGYTGKMVKHQSRPFTISKLISPLGGHWTLFKVEGC